MCKENYQYLINPTHFQGLQMLLTVGIIKNKNTISKTNSCYSSNTTSLSEQICLDLNADDIKCAD